LVKDYIPGFSACRPGLSDNKNGMSKAINPSRTDDTVSSCCIRSFCELRHHGEWRHLSSITCGLFWCRVALSPVGPVLVTIVTYRVTAWGLINIWAKDSTGGFADLWFWRQRKWNTMEACSSW